METAKASKYNSDLKHRAYYFAVNIMKMTRDLKIDRRYYSIVDQIIRSSASVGANLVESKNSISTKDFSRYIVTSLRSSNEIKYWLCLLRDGLEIKNEQLTILLTECDEISKMLAASVLKLNKKRTAEAMK